MRQNIIVIIIAGALSMTACKKSFLDRPPIASPTAATYYKSDVDILNGTGPLYNGSWGGYNGTSLQYIGDIMGGNSLTDNYNGRGSYLNFTVTAQDPSGALQSAYQALWSVIANANIVAHNIRDAGPGASDAARSSGLAECYVMRAAAYYFIALDWGAAPIIYDNSVQIGDSSIRRNNLADVWKFIISDLSWSAQHLGTTPQQPGRVTKWTAEGMLARAYLVRAGLGQSGGQRNQADLDSAKYWASDVCNNSGMSLYPSYYDLFTSAVFSGNKVPSECLLGLYWVPTGQWFVQNHMQANLAYDSKITQTGDGWGGAFGASPSLLAYYMDPANAGDSIRRKATIFLPNTNYPDINKSNGGWHVDTTLFNNATRDGDNAKITQPIDSGKYWLNGDRAYVKKYVIGSPADNGGLGGQQNENIGTYIFRLADVYLTYADAILGNNASTTDAEALKFFNNVRSRAGATPKTSITYADIFLEKKIEFAFEGHAWYDWKQWFYFDPNAALNYFSNQNRGIYNITYNGGNSFVTWFNDATSPATLGPRKFLMTADKADLPYPSSEVLVAPNLGLPPVAFDFSKVKY
ncbi:MAG TPA: RagB/SusD family nutrient uptake outer membrane protein [Puia sp.]|nr:RagB/SusD family nutrient uptake outer membrane protein [Puia sp.]